MGRYPVHRDVHNSAPLPSNHQPVVPVANLKIKRGLRPGKLRDHDLLCPGKHVEFFLVPHKYAFDRPVRGSDIPQRPDGGQRDYQPSLHIQHAGAVDQPVFVDSERIVLRLPVLKNRVHVAQEQKRPFRAAAAPLPHQHRARTL